ncbi:hypothetical protein [Nocardioides sp. GXZ039]|uniref:hypothetical protein n=1 Tax=Nocardioides sp. GXZ039 TaxID=3136018 RepID=UPI0030F45C75
MKYRVRMIAASAVTALLGAGLGAAAPAHAEQVRVHDGADATASPTDIRSVAVDHGARRVRVKVRLTDLPAHPEGATPRLSIYFDTEAGKGSKGPEFDLTAGLAEGSDFELVGRRGWKGPVGYPFGCAHRVNLDFERKVVRASVANWCLGSPDQLRVAVKMVDTYDASHPVTDWMSGPRQFTPWLAAG